MSILPHDPYETLASESGHYVQVHVSSKQTDSDDVLSAKVTLLAHDDKFESTTKRVTTPASTPGRVSKVPVPMSTTVSTTERVTTPASTPGRISEVPLPKSTIVVSEDDIKQVLTTPHVPIIPHDSDETLANENGHSIKVHNKPKDVTTTTTEAIIRRLIILTRESQTTPEIVPVDDDEGTLAIEHGRRVQVRVDPKYKVSDLPEMGGGVGVTPSPGGGGREWMPVDRRGGVDSETGCKLTFTSTAWIVCMSESNRTQLMHRVSAPRRGAAINALIGAS